LVYAEVILNYFSIQTIKKIQKKTADSCTKIPALNFPKTMRNWETFNWRF